MGLEYAQGERSPSLGCLRPSTLQLGSTRGFRLSGFPWMPLLGTLSGITFLEEGTSPRMEFFKAGKVSDELGIVVVHMGTTESGESHVLGPPSPVLVSVLSCYGLCTQCCCCPLDLGCLAWWGAREDAWWCWRARNALCALSGWIYVLLVKRGPGNTVEQRSQTSVLLFLAHSLLLFQTDLLPCQPLLHPK